MAIGSSPRSSRSRTPRAPVRPRGEWWEAAALAGAATAGGGAAGALGGLAYGLIATARPDPAGAGALSLMLVLIVVTMVVGMLGGAGVGSGIAIACRLAGRAAIWRIAGGAAGGLLVGAAVRLLGLDAFDLLVGKSPGDITGALEGLVLGGAVGAASWLTARAGAVSLRHAIGIAAVCGAAAGGIIALLGGRLMAGSLDQLARGLPGSRVHLDAIGRLFGEQGLGTIGGAMTTMLEGAAFSAGVIAAMALGGRGDGGTARS